jgi:hypothetical protein
VPTRAHFACQDLLKRADIHLSNNRPINRKAEIMAFWIKKKGEEGSEPEAAAGNSLKPARKKEEKKDNKPKRIDNMRIPQQLRISLRSLGSPNEFVFLTKDLSATGAFVLCPNIKRYPFQQQSTLLDCAVDLKEPKSDEIHRLQFLAKIARVVEAQGEGASAISGFGIRIVQISNELRSLLESFIQRHGAPDINNAAAEHAGLLPVLPPPINGIDEAEASEEDEGEMEIGEDIEDGTIHRAS